MRNGSIAALPSVPFLKVELFTVQSSRGRHWYRLSYGLLRVAAAFRMLN